MLTTKNDCSCLEFKGQIGLSRRYTDFRLINKIQAMIGERDSLYILYDMIEFDDCYLEVAAKNQVKQNLKRGKASQRQANVAVTVESTLLKDPKTGERDRACRYYKMEVLGKINRNM